MSVEIPSEQSMGLESLIIKTCDGFDDYDPYELYKLLATNIREYLRRYYA